MSKYFVEKEEDTIKFSEYILEVYEPERADVKYLIKQLGDVELPKSKIKQLHSNLKTISGIYDVRYKPETIRGIYEIIKMYPFLSDKAIEVLGEKYISDLFDKNNLMLLLGKLIEVFGKTDEAFEVYISYIDKKAKELQKIYDEEAEQLNQYELEYGKSFVDYFKDCIKRKHIPFKKIENSLPSPELIKKDEEQLLDLSTKTRIHLGVGMPISYLLIEKYIEDEELIGCPEVLSYYINNGLNNQNIPVTFTKTEFLESIKKEKKVNKK